MILAQTFKDYEAATKHIPTTVCYFDWPNGRSLGRPAAPSLGGRIKFSGESSPKRLHRKDHDAIASREC
jgi:hypothetical protein